MRLFIITIFLFNLSTIVKSQSEPFQNITTEPMVIYKYNFTADSAIISEYLVVLKGIKFRTIGKSRADKNLGPITIVQFTKIKENKLFDQDRSILNSKTQGDFEFFCVKTENLESSSRKKYFTWKNNLKPSIGTLVVPIKIRPKIQDKNGLKIPSTFSTDFTLGSSFGISARISPYKAHYLSLVGVFGVTTVGADSSTTEGFLENDSKLAAITPGLGLIADFDGFQIGLVLGTDIVAGDVSEKWIYNNKLWFSFGIGYQFLKKKEK